MLISYLVEIFSGKFKNDIFLIINIDCQEHADIKIDSEVIIEDSNLPLFSLMIFVTTLMASFVASLIEFSIEKMSQSKKDSRSTDDDSNDSDGHDNVGSDKKLLPWPDKIEDCSRNSNHSV